MRSVLPIDIATVTMDNGRLQSALDSRPELRKHKTMKTIEEIQSCSNQSLDEASESRIPRSTTTYDAKRVQLLRDYEMAASILESRNRGDFARRKAFVSFEHKRISMDKTFRTAPGGRARVVLDEDDDEAPDAVVRRSLRAASEAYLRDVPVTPPSSSDNSSSSREDDSGSSTSQKKKKKSVSFQDETAAGESSVTAMSSSARRHLMDQARCNDDESGPGNGHTSSPIHAACYKGDHAVVAHLLSFYGSQDAATLVDSACSCGMTPLQVACDAGHARVAKLLLRRQARVAKRSSHGVSSPTGNTMGFAKKRHRSCLALAVARRHTDIVELLLEYGAHVDEDALVTASSLGDVAIVRVLLQTSGKKSGLASGLEKLWGGSSSSSSSGSASAGSGEIDPAWISHAAVVTVANAHPGMLQVLLGDGHSTASKNRIVHCAVEAVTLADYKLLRCLTKLFDHALLMSATDAHHNTLLHIAVRQSSTRCVTLLIRLGVDVNARDALGITPLYVACARGLSSIVKLLLHGGATCTAMGPNDETPLHIAAQENHLSCVTMLLVEGHAPVDGTTLDKCTALHLACQRGNTQVAKCLLDHGADVNARTVCDETPLLKASRMSNMETVKLLLSRDAEVTTSSTSSISSSSHSVARTAATTADDTRTASTSSSVFSMGSSVRSHLEVDAESSSHSRSSVSTGSSSSSSRHRRHQHSQALLQRLSAHQLPRRAEEAAEDAAAAEALASANADSSSNATGRKSFKGWLKSVVKHK